MLSTILEAGRLLKLFDPSHPEWGVTEVAEALSINKAKAHYILASLVEVGLLRRTAKARYRLGWQILALSQVLLMGSELWVESEDVMRSLAKHFDQHVFLATLEGTEVVIFASLNGDHTTQTLIAPVVFKLPVCSAASGRVLLAYRPWPETEAVVRREGGLGVVSFGPTTTLEGLKRELDLVRVNEYAYCFGGHAQCGSYSAVAAPVRDSTGSVIGAIGLGGSSHRFDRNKEEYRCAVVDAARQVSKKLGWLSPRNHRPANAAASRAGSS